MHEFYSTLRTTIEQVPHHNFLAIAGDMNAKLGPDVVNFSFNKETNRNGEMLSDFMQEYNLFSFWTFQYPSGKRSQIDYIQFRKKWRKITCKTCSWF